MNCFGPKPWSHVSFRSINDALLCLHWVALMVVNAHVQNCLQKTSLVNHYASLRRCCFCLLLLVRLHDQSSSSDEVGGLLQVLQAPI